MQQKVLSFQNPFLTSLDEYKAISVKGDAPCNLQFKVNDKNWDV
jgi:hypothetical protein